MEKFIREGKYILTFYEWCLGDAPSDKVLKARQKLLDKKQAEIVRYPEDAKETSIDGYKIHRKGRL